MEEKTIDERAAELLDRFGEIHDAYIRSIYHALDLADEAYREDEGERAVSYRELQAEADAATAGFERVRDCYADDEEGFWKKYGAAEEMENIDVLMQILLTEGEPDVR